MIVLSNADAIEFLECATDPELGCNIGTEEQYATACVMLVTLQQEDNTQQLVVMLVADPDPMIAYTDTQEDTLRSLIDGQQPVKQCPMPTISLPIMEQLG
jgi:hypothetical protein